MKAVRIQLIELPKPETRRWEEHVEEVLGEQKQGEYDQKTL